MKKVLGVTVVFLFIVGYFILPATIHAQTSVSSEKTAVKETEEIKSESNDKKGRDLLFDSIIEGVTTENEVLQWIGKPDEVVDNGYGNPDRKCFVYTWTNFKCNLGNVSEVSAGLQPISHRYYIFINKATGIVTSKATSKLDGINRPIFSPIFSPISTPAGDPYGSFERKPVIYLYPLQKEQISVRLEYQGNIIVSYPKYDESIKGWKVIAYPDGRIIDLSDNREYSYLFWEGVLSQPAAYDFSKGFIVEGEKTAEFLQDILKKFGLTPKEYNEFIVYWYPKMKDNKYNLVHFAGEEYEKTARLDITPKPDSVLRVFMVYKSLNKKIDIAPQEIKPFVRKGFTVVEWGGTEIK